MTRVSPPELAREFPGPQESSTTTFAPRRTRCKAVQPPNAPAPTTATRIPAPAASNGETTREALRAKRAAPPFSRDRREKRREDIDPRQPTIRTIRNAVAAARPPMRVVCQALFRGGVPVQRPLM